MHNSIFSIQYTYNDMQKEALFVLTSYVQEEYNIKQRRLNVVTVFDEDYEEILPELVQSTINHLSINITTTDKESGETKNLTNDFYNYDKIFDIKKEFDFYTPEIRLQITFVKDLNESGENA